MNKQTSYAVIVGRFQTPYLTKGHKYLFEEVLKQHDNLIVFIGIHRTQPTRRNPLDFETRRRMICEYVDHAHVLSIHDNVSNEAWSQDIDSQIKEIVGDNEVVLYGCRDSFISYYGGEYPTQEIRSPYPDNATDIRQDTAKNTLSSEDFRRGVIYGITGRFPSPYLAVDIAPLNDKRQVLLAKKPNEKFFRFIGGFLDSTDKTISAAALREFKEEAGENNEVKNFQLIGEARIDDWRYRKDHENIFTNFFKCDFVGGEVVASDDIGYLEWVDINKLMDVTFMPEHVQLRDILIENLNDKQ